MCQTAINLIEKEGRSPKAVMSQIRALRKKSGFLKSDQKVLRKMLSKKLLRGKKERATPRSRRAVDIINLTLREAVRSATAAL